MVGFRLYGVLASAALLLSMLWQAMGLPASTPAGFPVVFYQHGIGHLDGRSCPSYPVCSAYARQAVARHGLLLGSWMALDRLIHETDDLHRGPWVRVDGEIRLNDSLERNSFWLNTTKDQGN